MLNPFITLSMISSILCLGFFWSAPAVAVEESISSESEATLACGCKKKRRSVNDHYACENHGEEEIFHIEDKKA